eukprot:5648644-Karenia_brevis.AAC.1
MANAKPCSNALTRSQHQSRSPGLLHSVALAQWSGSGSINLPGRGHGFAYRGLQQQRRGALCLFLWPQSCFIGA